jgi:hypothetical protein
MYKKESERVTEDVLSDPLNMNIMPGGHGGWNNHLRTKEQSKSINKLRNEKHLELLRSDKFYRDKWIHNIR